MFPIGMVILDTQPRNFTFYQIRDFLLDNEHINHEKTRIYKPSNH